MVDGEADLQSDLMQLHVGGVTGSTTRKQQCRASRLRRASAVCGAPAARGHWSLRQARSPERKGRFDRKAAPPPDGCRVPGVPFSGRPRRRQGAPGSGFVAGPVSALSVHRVTPEAGPPRTATRVRQCGAEPGQAFDDLLAGRDGKLPTRTGWRMAGGPLRPNGHAPRRGRGGVARYRRQGSERSGLPWVTVRNACHPLQ